MSTDSTPLNWFRHAAPYINDLRGSTLIIAVPGKGLEHENIRNLVHDLALLISLGIRLVVVFGARVQINRALKQQGIHSQLQHNNRVTNRTTLDVVKAAIGKLRFEIEATFSQGLPDSPMARSALKVVSGNFVTALPMGIIDGVDMHWAGKVRRMEVDAIQRALEQNSLVLLPPLGTSLTGELFNLNYLELAAAAARTLRAEKLILFRDSPRLLIGDTSISEMSIAQARQLTDSIESASLNCAVTACNPITQRIHLLSYKEDGALLQELLRREGVGTMVYRDNYETARGAQITDVGAILGLIRPLEKRGLLVRRSREKLEAEINYFTLIEFDGTPIACAALYPIQGEQGPPVAGEIACMAIHPDFRGKGRAATLLQHLEKQARTQGLTALYVLTTQAEHWFIEHGFKQVNVQQLPAERQSLYNIQRNSRVLRKTLPCSGEVKT
ncbi:MAG: amino-acid N-acetyltransferase [Gammaproteobacteria bacterium]|nr:amino-acid N-acetyltransferase [Gammaproteobacteria bacterium]